MKINVEVDLSDFYNEEDESSFNEQIKNYIEYNVKNSVWNEFRKLTLDDFKAKIDAELAKGKEEELDRIITKVFTDKKIKVREGTKSNPEPEMVTLFEYIEEKLHNSYFSETKNADIILGQKLHDKQVEFEKSLSTASDKILTELKDRYDMLFASQIVSKLNKQGMLKDDVSKLLLNNNE